MKNLLFIVLFSMCGACVLYAQDTHEGSDTTAVEKKSELPESGKSSRYESRRERFDRGIEKVTFVPSGQWFTGVSFSYFEHFNENYEILILDNWTGQGYTMSVQPTVGYMIKDNLGLGASFSYDRTLIQMDDLDISLGEDLDFSIADYHVIKHIYTGTIFLRTFINIGNSRRFGLFNDIKLQVGGGQAKITSGKGKELTGRYQDIFELGVVASPGLCAFINDFIAAEVSVGVLGFKYKDIKQLSNQVEDGHWRQSSADFRINILALNMGVVFYL